MRPRRPGSRSRVAWAFLFVSWKLTAGIQQVIYYASYGFAVIMPAASFMVIRSIIRARCAPLSPASGFPISLRCHS